MGWSRDLMSLAGIAGSAGDVGHFDSNLPTKLSSQSRTDVASTTRSPHRLEPLPAAASDVQQSGNQPKDMRSRRMSSVSEQDHLNPRDPLYYAPRWLRERSATRGASSETAFSPVSFDIQLESA